MLGFVQILKFLPILLPLVCFPEFSEGKGILYPRETETREVKSLDGIWNFRIANRLDPDVGFREEWFNRPLSQTGAVIPMPVPSSYNDVTQDKSIRDHIGWAWYDSAFWIPTSWVSNNNNRRVHLRFGGVNYHAVVWINGVKVVEHSGGHLPFAAELNPNNLSATGPNRITVAVNNTLSKDTVPQGELFRPDPSSTSGYPPGYFIVNYNFDFFNYAGIHRPVQLYTTPMSYIDDITVTTSVQHDIHEGTVNYAIDAVVDNSDDISVSVKLLDKLGRVVASSEGGNGGLKVPQCNLWWPFTMVRSEADVGYLYKMEVALKDKGTGAIEDVYKLKIGVRTLEWNATGFWINSKPFYFRGFGRHEDSNIRGRGIDNVINVKDHNLIKWSGANSYRTSHYPYSEELLDLCDEQGIAVIAESGAVSLDGFGPKLLEAHKQEIRELIQRDKNRPSVVMWSVANEPKSEKPEAAEYFNQITQVARGLDRDRPITIVQQADYSVDQSSQFADIIGINRYFGWYTDTGHTEVIRDSMIEEVQNWENKFRKPVMVTEYGADTIQGLHRDPDLVFTEEYQMAYMREHFKAFDKLRANGSLIGEMVWNFADFMTAQDKLGIIRVGGNRKGVFTRERQPKAAAHFLRTRYHLLAQEYDGYPIPCDLPQPVPIYNPDEKTRKRREGEL